MLLDILPERQLKIMKPTKKKRKEENEKKTHTKLKNAEMHAHECLPLAPKKCGVVVVVVFIIP